MYSTYALTLLGRSVDYMNPSKRLVTYAANRLGGSHNRDPVTIAILVTVDAVTVAVVKHDALAR